MPMVHWRWHRPYIAAALILFFLCSLLPLSPATDAANEPRNRQWEREMHGRAGMGANAARGVRAEDAGMGVGLGDEDEDEDEDTEEDDDDGDDEDEDEEETEKHQLDAAAGRAERGTSVAYPRHNVCAQRHALVTLVTGANSPYISGALTLAQSLVDVGSALHRIALVTPDVSADSRENLAAMWEVRGVDPIACNLRVNGSAPSEEEFARRGEGFRHRMRLFSSTCTKLRAWQLPYERILFMDADTIVVRPVDHLVLDYTASELYAAPDTFPPDNFNSGVMVLAPSQATFALLMALNREHGTSDGSDQALLNHAFCPHWHTAASPTTPTPTPTPTPTNTTNTNPNTTAATTTRPPDSPAPRCGRLPWAFNVYAGFFETFRALQVTKPKALF